MKRREALLKVSLLMGGTLSAPALTGILNGCTSKKAEQTAAKAATDAGFAFTAEQDKMVAELSEIIIPKTSTPGAKEAKVNEFIETMLTDCYEEKDQKSFLKGLDRLEDKSQKAHKKTFLELTTDQQTALLKEIAAEDEKKPEPEPAKPDEDRQGETQAGAGQSGTAVTGAPKPQEEQKAPLPFFRTLKELTLLGYFTSEIGATQALDYKQVPGRYEPCIPYKEGQKAQASV
ncbi:gluconate 2-dehydrogenase subunit 3 family protein [Rhodocytophaga aerolata]|uniref:Gluconate 2-dehydrogenase subunit 3 family protein n=1 Tax=Rhodocytophaga aerolata TaxID=455078 RepID=A0ABT8R1Z3_9BACT|nr:gluconate 2-dehydrogenase subunit 3 family protein [Rhodocytophaga aerolata]MDO1445328.1 gluconate 2-dehydrogenase subunit 3 family protein [Rhodocytophaga aerolata]